MHVPNDNKKTLITGHSKKKCYHLVTVTDYIKIHLHAITSTDTLLTSSTLQVKAFTWSPLGNQLFWF